MNASIDIERARFNMVQQQIRPWDVLDPHVLELLMAVRREEFVPSTYRELALADLEAKGIEPLSSEPGPSALAEEAEMKQCVLNALRTLPEIYASVYEIRDIRGLSAEETAKELHLNVATVKSRLHRARNLLRERLDCAIADLS